MITLDEFERAQVLLGKSDRARSKRHVFAYTGLIRCGRCGCGVTAEHKVNRHGSRYVYYHCTRKKRVVTCNEKCIEEDKLEEQIARFLRSVYLNEHEVDEALNAIEEERKKEISIGGGAKDAIEAALESCTRGLDNLTKLFYRELIGEDEFTRQRATLIQERTKLNQRQEQLGTEQWIEPVRNLIWFNNRAVFWLTHGTEAEKRLILSTIGSNPILHSKKLNIHARKPFVTIQQRGFSCNWSAIVNDVRTYFKQEAPPDFTIPELKPIPNLRFP
jgi:hypothetical protein